MKEEFEYGELVEVRDHDTEEWQKRHYLMTAPKGKFRYFTVHSDTRLDGFRISQFAVYPFAQMRKIQKPEPELIDIEQPETTKPSVSEREHGDLQQQIDTLEYLIEKLTEAVDIISNRVGIVMHYHEGLRESVNNEQKKTALLYKRIEKLENRTK